MILYTYSNFGENRVSGSNICLFDLANASKHPRVIFNQQDNLSQS
jgi:hypothetical protein